MNTALQAHYERLRTEIGVEHTERLGHLGRRDIARFAVASGAPHRPGAPDATVHPLMVSSILGWHAGPAEQQLGVDGTSLTDTRGLDLHGIRLMGAGQDLQFHAAVTVGTEIVVYTSMADVQLKHGRSGDLLLLQIRRRFTDDHDHPLVTCRESFIAR